MHQAMGTGTDIDEPELVRRWAEGDRDAGEALIRRHFDVVFRFFSGRVVGAVEDLVQQTFLACLERRERLAEVASFRAWLLGVARHKLYAHFDGCARDAAPFDPQRTTMHALLGATTAGVGRSLERRLLVEALARLPVQTQLLLELHYWEELSSAELAEVFDANAATIRSRLVAARDRLREELERSDYARAAAALAALERRDE